MLTECAKTREKEAGHENFEFSVLSARKNKKASDEAFTFFCCEGGILRLTDPSRAGNFRPPQADMSRTS